MLWSFAGSAADDTAPPTSQLVVEDASRWMWIFVGAAPVRVSAPILHCASADGQPFHVPLSLDNVRRESRQASLPGRSDVPAAVLCGSADVPSGPALGWELTIIPQASYSLFLHLSLKVMGAAE